MSESRKHPRVTNNSQIASLRIQRGLTQSQLAQMVGTHKNIISRWELGAATPNGKNLIKLAEALGCDAREILKSETIV